MSNRRIDILRELLTLSQIHLGFVLEEKWEDWESIAHQKDGLYRQLRLSKSSSIDSVEKEIINGILETEKKTLEELIHKRNETKKELIDIDRLMRGITNYRHSHQKSSKRHFHINV